MTALSTQRLANIDYNGKKYLSPSLCIHLEKKSLILFGQGLTRIISLLFEKKNYINTYTKYLITMYMYNLYTLKHDQTMPLRNINYD